MFAQYSPLFTSGLLSDSPATSRTPSPNHLTHKYNRESLPLTVNTESTSFYDVFDSARSPDEEDNAFFLTFKPHRRQIDHGRSFLSLDLAESNSMRSMSLRRKDSVSTTAFFGRSEPSSPSPSSPVSPPLEKRTDYLPFVPPSSPAPTLRRHSRETLRLPSPKPAPSSTLPEPPAPEPSPVSRSRRHRPSDLVLTLSACFSEVGPASSSSLTPPYSFHRPSYSAPSVMSPVLPQIHRMSPLVSPDNERSYFFFSPTSPTQSATFPPPPSMNVANRDSMPSPPRVPITPAPSPVPNAPALRASPSTRSTATVNTRQRNRSAALAALEGRGSHIHNPQHWRPRNFMSMSDDDDDEPQSGIDEEALRRKLLWVLNEEEGLVIPQDTENVKPPPLSASSNSPSPGRGRTERTSGSGRTTSSSTPSSSSKRSRRSTIESFFSPLTNFIDLKDDDLSTSWRSFVQISS